jgi:iron complex outermembrane receptor protein
MIYAPRANWVYRGSLFGNFFSSDEVRPFNVLDESNIAWGTRHRFTFEVKKRGHVTAGIEYFRERYAFRTFETLADGIPGQMLSDQTEYRSYVNGFVQSEWYTGPRWYAFAGLSSVWSQLSISSQEADIPMDVFPTLGVSYTTLKKLSVTASLSRGYSALSLNNLLNADGTLHSDIKPETGWSREISIKTDNGTRGYARINLFKMNIRNTIITRRIMDDVFERINGGSTIHRGIEIEVKSSNARQTISVEQAITFGKYIFDQFEDGGENRSGNKLPGIPQHRYFMRILYSPWMKVQVHLDLVNSSEVYLNDANTLVGQGYSLLHPGVRYLVWNTPKWEGRISATVHNLLDTHYASMFQINAPGSAPRYYYPGKPRSFYLNFSLRHELSR